MNIDDAIKYLKETDSTMNKIINSVGAYSIKTTNNPFLALIEAIISQQLTGKAAQSIYKKFISYYDTNEYDLLPASVLLTADNIMKSFGLSYKKIEYIKLLSNDIIRGNIDLKLLAEKDDEEIINELTKMKGIGRWTAEMFLIFCLGRKDVFPLNDLGIKKALQKWYLNYENVDEQYIIELSNIWKPYRSIASWYLWKSLSNFDAI
ncbi:MAG TPA: DNA-3-methyladenine glycosylase 2 family protein [Nitrososphaeraceae archaeon]|nr:DNA-3-methyladenine glycosylase 2 family protein [Nitrososphaeraceae archaeon]